MKLGALDVGSNTVLMLVVECSPGAPPCRIADMARITRLGRGVDATGRLDSESAARTLETIAEFADKARTLGAEKIVGAATAALRDAADGTEFVSRVQQRTGITLEIIAGESEAGLSYLATQKGLGLDPAGKLLIVDIGGGSTELIRAEPARFDVVSLQLGSVRLTERIVHHDPPETGEITGLREAVGDALHQLGWSYRPEAMVGIAGTVTTICAIALGLEQYSPEAIHGHQLAREHVSFIINRLAALPLEERKRMRGMEPGRADVLLAGAVILERLMAHFGVEQIIVSDQGVRWGLIWRELEKPSSPD